MTDRAAVGQLANRAAVGQLADRAAVGQLAVNCLQTVLNENNYMKT